MDGVSSSTASPTEGLRERRKRRTRERIVAEVADLWFHSYALLAARGLGPEDVEAELVRRDRG